MEDIAVSEILFLSFKQEQNLEISVVKILNKAKAEDYIPRFARHRITIETLVQMSEDDLKQVMYTAFDNSLSCIVLQEFILGQIQ